MKRVTKFILTIVVLMTLLSGAGCTRSRAGNDLSAVPPAQSSDGGCDLPEVFPMSEAANKTP